MSQSEGWFIREELDNDQVLLLYDGFPNLFTLKIHHGGRLTKSPGRSYVGGKINYVDLIDIDLFSVHEVSLMVNMLGYAGNEHILYHYCYPEKDLDNGLEDLSCDQDVLRLAGHVEKHKFIDMYTTHGIQNIKEHFSSPTKIQRQLTIVEIDDDGPYALVPAGLVFKSVGGSSGVGQSSSGVGQSSSGVFGHSGEAGQPSSGVGQSRAREEVDTAEFDFDEMFSYDLGDNLLDDGIDKGLGDNEQGNVQDNMVCDGIDDQEEEQEDDQEEEQEDDSDFIFDDENAMADHEVDMTDYRLNVDLEVEDNITNQQDIDLGDEVLDNDKFQSGTDSDDVETSIRRHHLRSIRRENENIAHFYLGQIFGTKQEGKKLIKKHFVDTRRCIRIVKDDTTRLRAECQGLLPDFDVDENGVHIDKCKGKEKVKGKGKEKVKGKGKETVKGKGKEKVSDKGKEKVKGSKGNNNKEKGAVVVNVGGRGKRTKPAEYLCPWTLLISKVSGTETWIVKTFIDEHKCLQTRRVRACTDSFLSEQMIDQIEENPGIPVKAVQDQFQRRFALEVSLMKAYRAKAKAKKQVEGDYASQYALLRDYAIELQDKNPGTTVKIQVEPPTNPSEKTRKFKRIYVCLGALKQGFKAKGRDLLGLDGAFMKGPFPGQVLTAVGIDPNNGIYPVCYAIVEAENINSWTWFLELLGDDLGLHTNSNFTFVSDRQKGILQAVNKLYPCAEHRYCLRHIHENMKVSFKGSLYKDMLWKCAGATTVPEFKIAMDELKAFNRMAHLWLSKISPLHWAKSPVPTTLTPPDHHKQVGRPKKARKRSALEVEDMTHSGRLSKKHTKGKCTKCGKVGHNVRTCKG